MAKEKVNKALEAAKKESEIEKLRKLDDATIQNNIDDLKKELFNLRFQAALGKLEQTDRIKKAKKQIARLKTVLSERKAKYGGLLWKEILEEFILVKLFLLKKIRLLKY